MKLTIGEMTIEGTESEIMAILPLVLPGMKNTEVFNSEDYPPDQLRVGTTIRITEAHRSWFTAGKCYEVISGKRIFDDDGDIYAIGDGSAEFEYTILY